MTLEEVINKINGLNAKLDDYILGIQFMPSKFNSKDLEEGAKSIERVVLDDPTVRAILADINNEQRQEYLDAIKQGVEKAKDILEKYRQAERDVNIKKAVVDIKKNAYRGVENVVSGMEELEKPDGEAAFTDDYRKQDLASKIISAEKMLEIAEKFQKMAQEFKDAGKKGFVTDAINEIEEVKGFVENCEEEISNIKDKSQTPDGKKKSNLVDKVEEYKELIKNGKKIDSPEVQAILNEMKQMAEFIDKMDQPDIHDKKILNITGQMPLEQEEFKDKDKVDEWIKDIESKYADTDLLEKLKLDNKFVKSRIDILDKAAEDKMKSSIVLKYLGINDPNNAISDRQKFLENIYARLKEYNNARGKTPADLKRMIEDAKRLYAAYELSTKKQDEVTISGKTVKLTGDGIDTADIGKKETVLEKIQSLDSDDEFKKEFDQKVKQEVEKAMIVYPKKPEYGRIRGFLYKMLEIATFGRYINPKDRYEAERRVVTKRTEKMKQLELTESLIQGNAEKVTAAKELVDGDKSSYLATATKQIIDTKKKITKKGRDAIVKKKDGNDSFTR